MSEGRVEASRGSWMRLLAVAPLLPSAAAAALVLVLAPGAWGKADDLPGWAPPAGILIVAVPVLIIAVAGALQVWKRTTGLFDVHISGAVVGGAAHWVAAIALVIAAGSMTSSSSYETQEGEQMSASGFIAISVIASFIGSSLLAGLTLVYQNAVTPGPRTVLARRPQEEEIDFVEQWAVRHRR